MSSIRTLDPDNPWCRLTNILICILRDNRVYDKVDAPRILPPHLLRDHVRCCEQCSAILNEMVFPLIKDISSLHQRGEHLPFLYHVDLVSRVQSLGLLPLRCLPKSVPTRQVVMDNWRDYLLALPSSFPYLHTLLILLSGAFPEYDWCAEYQEKSEAVSPRT